MKPLRWRRSLFGSEVCSEETFRLKSAVCASGKNRIDQTIARDVSPLFAAFIEWRIPIDVCFDNSVEQLVTLEMRWWKNEALFLKGTSSFVLLFLFFLFFLHVRNCLILLSWLSFKGACYLLIVCRRLSVSFAFLRPILSPFLSFSFFPYYSLVIDDKL